MAAGSEVQRGERKYSGHPRLYPCDGIGDVDEDVRARHNSKQLRGQVRGGARGGGSAPAAEHPPCPTL